MASMSDHIVELYEKSVDDEYERKILHQSSTIANYITGYSTIIAAAIVAWFLPGKAAYLSFLFPLAVFVGQQMGQRWMRQRVPAPRAVLPSTPVLLLMVPITGLWVGGLLYNTTDNNAWSWIGAIVGAVVGGVASFFYMKKNQQHNRNLDEERLAAADPDDY